MSADHIPAGGGVWPSFWLTSATGTWACNGEIDIIEGVNSVDANSSHNVATLHTSDKPGVALCRSVGVPGISNGGNCASPGTGSTCGCDNESGCPFNGCGVALSSAASFGKGFNDAGGGTYACELTPAGAVTMWFFPRGQEPAYLLADEPNPGSWPATNRTMFNPCPGQFKDLEIVVNTTLCGDWSGAVYPGGMGKCISDVAASNLSEAYWSIDYIKTYIRADVAATATAPASRQWYRPPPLR